MNKANKAFTILAPISVLGFVVMLAVMYGWVGTMDTTAGGEAPETPELNVAALQTQLVNNPTFPSGLGNGQIQLINNPTFPAGIGNGQIKLINQALQGSPYFGAVLDDLPAALAGKLGLKADQGVYVKSVAAASPAEKGGLKAGDVILKFDNKNVSSHQQIGQIIQTKKVGATVKIVVNRNGKKSSMHVKLENPPEIANHAGAAPGNTVAAPGNGTPNPFQPAPASRKIWLGADIQDIDAVMQLQFSLPDTRGVIVSHVTPNSPAVKSGLKSGDVIRRFNGTRIKDVNQLQSIILKSQPGKKIELTI
ncbi:MAG: PDZ domain-containing protein, partial [Desulfamplus sp.]|nr:PDZ domain-containing protein [Desulfamplus sp.]